MEAKQRCLTKNGLLAVWQLKLVPKERRGLPYQMEFLLFSLLHRSGDKLAAPAWNDRGCFSVSGM